MIKRIVLALISSMLAAASAFSQTPSPMLVQSERIKMIASPPAVPLQNTEILLLREQNKLLKDYQSSQQATVYWALGGILSFVVVLTGLSLFTNFKFYEQDKDRLRREFEDKVVAYRSEFSLQIESHKGEILQVLDQKNQLMQDRVFTQLSEVRSLIEGVRAEVLADVKKNASDVQVSMSDISSLKKGLEAAEMELRDVESVVWDIREIPGNILITRAQGVRAAVKAGSVHDVKRLISSIEEILINKYKKTGVKIDPFVAERLSYSFGVCESFCPEGVAKVRDILSGIPLAEKKEPADIG